MKAILATLAAAFLLTTISFGLAEENFGPDSSRGHPTTEQAGVVKITKPAKEE